LCYHYTTRQRARKLEPICPAASRAQSRSRRELAVVTGPPIGRTRPVASLWPVKSEVHYTRRFRTAHRAVATTKMQVKPSASLGGCGFCAEQDLSAFSGCFDFQGLPALCHQRARMFHHFVDHFVVMIRIVMEKQELAHV
jgi:hypothetical protein